MDESAQSQRLLLAAILSFAILMGWYYVFPPKKTPPSGPVVAGQTEGTKSSSLAKSSTPAAVAASSTVSVPREQPSVAIEHAEFTGSVGGPDPKKPMPFKLVLTNEGGGVEHFELPSYHERDSSNQATKEPIALSQAAGGADLYEQMAGLQFEDASFSLPPRPVYEVAEKQAGSVRYRYRTGGVEIEREYHVRPDSFEIEMAVSVRNRSADPQHYRLAIGAAMTMRPELASGGFLFMPPPDHMDGLCYSDGKVRRAAQKSLAKETERFQEGVKWVAIDRQYFVAAIIQRDGVEATCELSGRGLAARAALRLPATTLGPGEERRHKFTAYLGVKQPSLLTQADAQLEAAVDYTILGLNLALLCQGLLFILGLIHRLSGSWGVAILGLTVIVKLILFPLNQRSGKSMRAMSALKPEMDKIREKFPEDRQRQSEELMKLYKQYGVNPASGCLPILLQMPIWFALYRALWVSIDLYQESFLWMPDLTARDPFWILPVALVLVMFVQQKMTPSTMDPTQQKIMLYMMPLIFGATMAALPAGLAFYILVNSLLTIAQQHFINRSIGPVAGPASAPGATA